MYVSYKHSSRRIAQSIKPWRLVHNLPNRKRMNWMKTWIQLWRTIINVTVLAAAFLISGQAEAATLTVESFADNLGNPFTLRTKISQAQDGDTIAFSRALDGFTITLLNGELLITNSITIMGPTNANLSIVGGNVSNPLKK